MSCEAYIQSIRLATVFGTCKWSLKQHSSYLYPFVREWFENNHSNVAVYLTYNSHPRCQFCIITKTVIKLLALDSVEDNSLPFLCDTLVRWELFKFKHETRGYHDTTATSVKMLQPVKDVFGLHECPPVISDIEQKLVYLASRTATQRDTIVIHVAVNYSRSVTLSQF